MAARRDTISRKIEEVYNDPNLSRREKAQKKRELELEEAKRIRNEGQDRGIIKSLQELNQEKERARQQRYKEYDEQMELERRLAAKEQLSEAEAQRLHVLQQKEKQEKEAGITWESQNSLHGLPKLNDGTSNQDGNDEFMRNNTFKRLNKIKFSMMVPSSQQQAYNLSPQTTPEPSQPHNPNQKVSAPVDYSGVQGNILGQSIAYEIAQQRQSAAAGLPKLNEIDRTQTEIFNESTRLAGQAAAAGVVDKPDTIDEFKKKQAYLQQQRQIKKQLFAARAQMSILRARLGMDDHLDDSYNPAASSNLGQRRKSSISLGGAIDEVTKFEKDLKEAIDKVSDLTAKVEIFQKVVGQGEDGVIGDNLALQKEMRTIKTELDSVKTENGNLKKQLGKLMAEKFNRDDKTGKDESKEEAKDPFDKYKKMIKLGSTMSKVVEKMKNDGLTNDAIEKFKKEQNELNKKNAKFQDNPLEKFERMRKMGLPMNSIENKMKMEGIDPKLIEEFKNGGAKKKEEGADYSKYDGMKKMGLPIHVITNKMKMDGLTADQIEKWQNPGAAKAANAPDFTKYEGMKKMGLPMHAIENKMKMDGLTPEQIETFKNPAAAGGGAVSTVDYSKYERMKKMGMPENSIVNKMRMDGLSQENIDRFLNPQAAGGGGGGGLLGAALDLSALKKYERMKTMGLPMNSIVNKMRMDGISKELITAFENPGQASQSGGGGGGGILGGLFKKKEPELKPKPALKPNVDMKRFHWGKIDTPNVVKNSIWNNIDESEVKIDISGFENLFRIPEKKPLIAFGAKKSNNGSDEKKDSPSDEILFVPKKRQYNLEIQLKRLKLNGEKLKQDIVSMNESRCNTDLLLKLVDMVPEAEEQAMAIEQAKQHGKKSHEKFGLVERFFYDLSDIWELRERIQIWIFKKQFQNEMQDRIDKIGQIKEAFEAIEKSESVKEFFKVILAFGNYMNAGHRNGKAYGFQLTTLRMLSNTKSHDNKYSLLMYIYRWCQENRREATTFRDELANVRSATRIDLDLLEKSILATKDEIDKMPDQIKQHKKNKCGKNDQFPVIMDAFVDAATQNVENLLKQFKDVRSYGKKVAAMYAFELENDDVSQLLKVFDEFLKDLDSARAKVSSLKAQEKKDEQKRLQKQRAAEKLLKNMAKRAKKEELSKKGIVKDADKIQAENDFKTKLKHKMKAHVRKQTAMLKQFGDDLMDDFDDDEAQTNDETNDGDDGDVVSSPFGQQSDQSQHRSSGKPKPPLPPPHNPHVVQGSQSSVASFQSNGSVLVHDAGGVSLNQSRTVRFGFGASHDSNNSNGTDDDITRAQSARAFNGDNIVSFEDDDPNFVSVDAQDDEDDNENDSDPQSRDATRNKPKSARYARSPKSDNGGIPRQKTFSYRGKGNTQVIDSKKKWTHAHHKDAALSRHTTSKTQQTKSKENLLTHKKSLGVGKKHVRRETKLKMLMQNLDTINGSEPPSDTETESKDNAQSDNSESNTNTNNIGIKTNPYLPKSPKQNASLINAGATASANAFGAYSAYGNKKQKSLYANKFSKPRSDSTVEEF